jgi:Zn-dependent protease with chaperone function
MQISFITPSRIILTLIAIAIIGFIISGSTPVCQQLSSYATRNAEQLFGATPLAPAQEEKIRSIAQEMEITQPFTVKRMNQQALATFGYHNAFAHIPLIWNFFPTRSTPILFISEGFFEDLSPEEQRFLIGHELVHIQERHTEYLPLAQLTLLLLLIVLWGLLRKKFLLHLTQAKNSYYDIALGIILGLLLVIFLNIPNLAALDYRRHIEWEADRISLQALNSYDGCIRFMDRLECEYHVPSHNPYFGLISDHPSCSERKNYCIIHRNMPKEKL